MKQSMSSLAIFGPSYTSPVLVLILLHCVINSVSGAEPDQPKTGTIFQSSLLRSSKCTLAQFESYYLDIAKLMTVGQRKWPESFPDSKPFCA